MLLSYGCSVTFITFFPGRTSTYNCIVHNFVRTLCTSLYISFVFFVDDHMYEDITGLSSAQLSTRRNQLYKQKSGKNAKLPEAFRKIMKKYGFSEREIIRHNHGKKGREDCLYFSEKILRASKRKIKNLCAREYIEFLENKKYFNKNTNYMVAIIPTICERNICHFALDLEIKGLSSSHVFMNSMLRLSTRKQLFSSKHGVTYRKD